MKASYLVENRVGGQIQLHTQIIDWQGRHDGCGPAGVQVGVAGVGQLHKQGPAAQMGECRGWQTHCEHLGACRASEQCEG